MKLYKITELATHQKKNFGYIETNAEKLRQFLEEIQSIDPTPIVYSYDAAVKAMGEMCQA